MNYIRHLTGFFDRVTHDSQLNPSHIALYIALFQFWNVNRFRNPISISRDEVMRISKISSKATYHKCLKHLHAQGYIRYEPSYNPYRGSHVHLINLADDLRPDSRRIVDTRSKNSPVLNQVPDKSYTSFESGNEQAEVPSLNSTNLTNSETEENTNTNTLTSKRDSSQKLIEHKEEKLRQKKKVHPSLDKVTAFFQSSDYPDDEASKFYNYYQSNGWLIGGKTPMADWQAAARSWMLKTIKSEFHDSSNTSRNLNISPDKNYAEPL